MLRVFATLSLPGLLGAAPVNIVFLLSNDHRHDLMGFHSEAPEWLETPALDRLAKEAAQLANAFVTASLCSPSRASILTGQYMHHHRVVDNQRPVPGGRCSFRNIFSRPAARPPLSASGTWRTTTTNPVPVSTTGNVVHDPEQGIEQPCRHDLEQQAPLTPACRPVPEP